MTYEKNHDSFLFHYALPHSYLAFFTQPNLACSVRSLREHMIKGVASTAIPFKQMFALYRIYVLLFYNLLQLISSYAVVISFSPHKFIVP